MQVVREQLATSPEQWRALLDSDAQWVVRNEEDWKALLASEDNPLKNIDQEVVRAFTEGLVFNKGGLAGADYTMLEEIITFAQFYRLWEHFGLDRGLCDDYKDYKCDGRGNCRRWLGFICTRNC